MIKGILNLLLIFILTSALNSCLYLGDGSNTIVKESANNGHNKKAVLFLREAGTTVANSYQISITDYKTEFDTLAVGNTFTVDDDHGKANLNQKAINFNWLADDTLEISYDKNLRTFIQLKAVDGVVVIYKTK